MSFINPVQNSADFVTFNLTMDPLDEYLEQDEPSQLGDIEIDMKMESLSNIHFGKSEVGTYL